MTLHQSTLPDGTRVHLYDHGDAVELTIDGRSAEFTADRNRIVVQIPPDLWARLRQCAGGREAEAKNAKEHP